MQQAQDFLAESDALAAILQDLPEAEWKRKTQFKDWTINDVIVHLYFWNRGADNSLVDPEAFQAMFARLMPAMQSGLRPFENAEVSERGRALFDAWQGHYRDMAARWAEADPKTRVKWAGPDMSVRSSISARQMETWAHGQEVFDLLGQERQDADRISNVVMLGVNAFGWSHKVHGLDVPDHLPTLMLTAPSGAVWTYGEDAENRIEGAATEFCQVVTQTRNIADTGLKVTGPVATQWMAKAQCFAGPPETPPAPGVRHVVTR
ncbi:MAG: TIGR03084 family metal-binding protein [Paracoccaceae bacterium]